MKEETKTWWKNLGKTISCFLVGHYWVFSGHTGKQVCIRCGKWK
jgi:hypothetical protein